LKIYNADFTQQKKYSRFTRFRVCKLWFC
jgi:hypothetical protein